MKTPEQEPRAKAESEIEDLLAQNRALKKLLRNKSHQLFLSQREKEQNVKRITDLRNYLNLFLSHPAYKVFKFFKKHLEKLMTRTVSEPVVTDTDPHYQLFQRLFEPGPEDLKQMAAEAKLWSDKPSLDVVTAVFRPPLPVLEETLLSLLNQTYPHWNWHIADASGDEKIWQYLQDLATKDSRIKPVRLPENKGISANTNAAIRQGSAEFIVLLDHDDRLAPNALHEVASVIRNHDVDFVYSDCDKLDEAGRRCEPLFKPDWSPEAMLSINMLTQLSAFRRSLLDQAGYFNPELDGAQDWDLFLRISECTNRIHHVPRILYHWRKSEQSTAQATENKSGVQQAQAKALSGYLSRRGLTEPQVRFDPNHRVYRTHPKVHWRIPNPRMVSIIIPSRDQVPLLQRCLDTLFQRTTYSPYEMILVDTGSTDPATESLYSRYSERPNFRVIRYEEEFNFSRACNFGARHALGDLLLFLNNDTEILHGDWLERMAQWFEISGIGIVGAKLLYPDGKIQHAGVIFGMGGIAAHVFAGCDENISSIFGSDGWYRNMAAVTGACMMISREAFTTLHGFDEGFRLNWSDVDLCLRAWQSGYRILYTPEARLLHHESATHGRRIPRADFERSSREWHSWLMQGDRFFNPNLSYGHATPRFRLYPNETSMEINLNLMARLPQKDMIAIPDDLI
jgi:GT2 family glycosyltransferase